MGARRYLMFLAGEIAVGLLLGFGAGYLLSWALGWAEWWTGRPQRHRRQR